MAAQTKAELILELRDIVGDNVAGSPFLSDDVWDTILNRSERKLKKYARIDDEVTVDGTGAYEYAIPTSVQNTNIINIFKRSGADHTTDSELKEYDIHNNKIYSSCAIAAGEKLVFWIKRPYILGTDELTEDALELLYAIAGIEYINAATYRRADYAQWAALNRSDVSINQLMLMKQSLKDDLADLAKTLGDGTEVSNFGRY